MTFVIAYSCEEMTVPDLADKELIILAPPDSIHSTSADHILWWEPVEGIDFYHLQVVSPSFAETQFIMLDSNVTTNHFEMAFNQGVYEWRVKAVNIASETRYEYRTIFIDSIESMGYVEIISPKDNEYTNETLILFSWNYLANADKFLFEIYDLNDSLILTRVMNEGETTVDISQTDNSREGRYFWNVQAIKSTEITSPEYHAFTIDTTKPAVPVLLSPKNDTTFTDSLVIFSWHPPENNGSPIISELYVSTDSLFSQTEPKVIENGYEEEMIFESGTYYWYLKYEDKAGNSGETSETRKFSVSQ